MSFLQSMNEYMALLPLCHLTFIIILVVLTFVEFDNSIPSRVSLFTSHACGVKVQTSNGKRVTAK
ncbi:hypothetical protein GCM10008935_23510 [Alkalibacillus silvisoli]|uniref:Transmembrane protein n=1 Tax=Alkalibacillus silvisoli TaxID=392823 RepID=A0ABP3JZN6_9BACI